MNVYVSIFLIVLLSEGVMAMGEEANVNTELLEKYRVDSIVSGVYLDAWNKLIESDNKIPELNNYLVNFSEDENYIIIYFSKPVNKPLPGGGGGKVKICKKTGKVGELKLSR